MSSIVNYFPNTHLGKGHVGLAELSRIAKKPIEKLRDGEFNLFINRKQTMLKLYGNSGMIIHYRHPEDHRINLDTIKLLPKYLDGGNLNYKGALREVLEKDFGIKR